MSSCWLQNFLVHLSYTPLDTFAKKCCSVLAACYIFMFSLQFVSWQICWTNMLELTFWCSCDIGQSNSTAAYIAYYHFSLSHTQSKRLYFSKHHFRDGDISVFQSLVGGNFTILSYVPNNNTKRSQKEWSLILFCNLIELLAE